MTFIQSLNEQYFSGSLSSEVLSLLDPINHERAEVHAFVERVSKYMHRQRLDAKDFSEATAWIITSFIPKMLPGAWNGAIPPITMKGRHIKIDQYLAKNPWRAIAGGDTLLDLGCGFPPETTIDSVDSLPGVQVIGADPSFGYYLIKDKTGNYACFDSKCELLYFQPGTLNVEAWEAMYSDPQATKTRYLNYLDMARASLAGPDDQFATWVGEGEEEGVVVQKNPVLQFERDRLRFLRCGIGAELKERFDAIRCFNVLLYFDHAFRQKTLEWAAGQLNEGGLCVIGMDWICSRAARYTVYQLNGGTLAPREFAISIDNLRPIEIQPWFVLFDEDYETARMVEIVRILRGDRGYRQSFDQRMDELLAEQNLCPRKDNGYLGGLPPNPTQDLMVTRPNSIYGTLEKEGYVKGAVDILQKHGFNAWVNCVGHIAIEPSSMKL